MKLYRIKLKELMTKKGVNITQVSKETGLSRTTLTAIVYEEGRGIQMKTINKLCNYFDITPAELFEEIKKSSHLKMTT
nr:MAG TPA: Cro/C1-type HTH DNA-binding domain protein [Caudoviricetes sp.]